MKIFVIVCLLVLLAVCGGEARLSQAFVDAHNAARADEKKATPALPTVSWDSKLAARCEANLGRKCESRHDDNEFRKLNTKYAFVGQNLASLSSGPKSSEIATKAVDMWMEEKKLWNGSAKKCTKKWEECGHYTQVVWRASTKIGCAIRDCGSVNYVCCNYGPAGNFNGKPPY